MLFQKIILCVCSNLLRSDEKNNFKEDEKKMVPKLFICWFPIGDLHAIRFSFTPESPLFFVIRCVCLVSFLSSISPILRAYNSCSQRNSIGYGVE